ncbi:MAG: arginine--tRNA ligase [Gemmatimonadetes bacterium]|nr:arginine--tRNA ligase [Gemmatimonadota bacterium]
MSSDVEILRAELTRAAKSLGAQDGVEPVLERPRDPAFGDWATNLAMVLAKPLGQKPRDLAQKLIEVLDKAAAGISSAEVAGPGFINFRMDAARVAQGIAALVAADRDYGRSEAGKGLPVVVEFVSANPTGPLHVGHGRQAALGDAISSLLEWTGWKVSREFYYNDAGVQIENLAKSTLARVRETGGHGLEIPEGGYHGEYVRDIAKVFLERHPELAATVIADPTFVVGDVSHVSGAGDAARRLAVEELRKEQDLDLRAFGVRFDTYYLESSLYADGRVERTVERLVASGKTYEKDGALFLRTTDYGDDQDRVMRKSAERGGTYTYFVPDVAYHVTKWERGFTRAVNVQGSDHHSTVTRVRAGLQALGMGIPEGYPEYVLHQMVTVMKSGEEVKISKRAGSYVTVRDLIDEVGRDAVRYFFLMRKGDTQLSFDVDLARSQSEENPVYYIQMAHARLSGIFRVGEIDPASIDPSATDLSPLVLEEETELMKALLDFPALVAGAAEALEPQRVATYLHDTAGRIHLWYHKAHVLNEPEPIMRARLVLARAAQIVIRNGLTMLGITAPERM